MWTGAYLWDTLDKALRRAFTPLLRRNLFLAGVVHLIAFVAAVGVAWACVPSGGSISVNPTFGVAGSQATVTGADFPPGDPRITWNSPDGPVLAHPQGPDFTVRITIPNVPPGVYMIVAGGNMSVSTARPFEVVAPPPGPAPKFSPRQLLPPPDTFGPTVFGAALTAANGTRRVSRNGEVTLVCGRFMESGVTGQCGARSANRLRAKTSGRRVMLRLRAKRFRADPGRPVRRRFRLTKSSLKLLKAARKVRMRGSVKATDALGNSTTTAFRFALKAPK